MKADGLVASGASRAGTVAEAVSASALVVFHGAALVRAEHGDAATFASVAVGHLPFLGRLLTEHGRQIDGGHYPDDDGTVQVHAAAMDHLIQTSRTRASQSTCPSCSRPCSTGGSPPVAAGTASRASPR